jgi:hypothetical protein
MNPANFQHAMMVGQGMPQGMPSQQNMGNMRQRLLSYFQQNQTQMGWQAAVQPIERAGFVTEL